MLYSRNSAFPQGGGAWVTNVPAQLLPKENSSSAKQPSDTINKRNNNNVNTSNNNNNNHIIVVIVMFLQFLCKDCAPQSMRTYFEAMSSKLCFPFPASYSQLAINKCFSPEFYKHPTVPTCSQIRFCDILLGVGMGTNVAAQLLCNQRLYEHQPEQVNRR